MSLRDLLLETPVPTENNDYKLMKSLNIGKDQFHSLTDKSALDLINQAHEAAEEVETIAFGLEMDDGEIVKVYVNAEEAEAFEKALGDMLGQEDDIEQALEKLGDEYDIVSVEWPEEREQKASEQGAPESQLDNQDADNTEEGEAEVGKEYALDFDLTSKEKKATDAEEEPEEKEGKGKEEKPEEGSEDEDKKPEEEEEGSDEEEDKDKDKEDEDEFDFGDLGEPKKEKKKKSAKKKAKEEVKESFSLFSDFLNRDVTITEKKEIFSAKELKLEDVFKTNMQQKIVKLLFLMDFPIDRLTSKKALVRKSIREKAAEINSNPKAKLLINKLIKDLSTLITQDEVYDKQHKLVSHYNKEDLAEAKDIEEKVTNKVQKVLIKLYKELGVPEILLNTKVTQLKQDTRKTAKIFASHSKVKSNFIKLSKLLGINEDGELTEELFEADGEADPVKAFSSDSFVNLVAFIAKNLGIPDANLEYKKTMLLNSIRQVKGKPNYAAIKTRLVALAKLLNEKELTNEELTNEEANSAMMNRAADLGDWEIGKLGSDGIVLNIEDVSIEIKEHSLETFKSSIENGFSTFIKDGNDEWQFKAIRHGKEYIAINEDSDVYTNGIILHEKDIDNILDILDEL